ncbi:hypothetical protein KJ966_21605 [bacterium]|nr:hypothetical protein [bacterium]
MLNNKLFWLLSRNTVLLVWIILFLFAFALPSPLAWLFKTAIVVLLLIHMTEIPFSLKIGREKQLTTGIIVGKTLLYGFTWWLPLRKGLIER